MSTTEQPPVTTESPAGIADAAAARPEAPVPESASVAEAPVPESASVAETPPPVTPTAIAEPTTTGAANDNALQQPAKKIERHLATFIGAHLPPEHTGGALLDVALAPSNVATGSPGHYDLAVKLSGAGLVTAGQLADALKQHPALVESSPVNGSREGVLTLTYLALEERMIDELARPQAVTQGTPIPAPQAPAESHCSGSGSCGHCHGGKGAPDTEISHPVGHDGLAVTKSASVAVGG